jgi:hypothetical protein
LKLSAVEKAAIVDELGQLEQDCARLSDKLKRITALRNQVREWFPKLGATKTATEQGHKFLCTIGEREHETSIDSMLAVFELLGQSTFIDNCGFTLKALRALLKPADVALLVTTERTGPRPIETFAIAKGK